MLYEVITDAAHNLAFLVRFGLDLFVHGTSLYRCGSANYPKIADGRKGRAPFIRSHNGPIGRPGSPIPPMDARFTARMGCGQIPPPSAPPGVGP